MQRFRLVLAVASFTTVMVVALSTVFVTPAAAYIGCWPDPGNWCQEGQCCDPYWPEIGACQDEFDDCASNTFPDPPAQSCYDAYDTCTDDSGEIRDFCLDHFGSISWCYEI